MALVDCIREAGNTGAGAVRVSSAALLDEMRQQLWQRISSERLAHMASENPSRAESEIRTICRQIYEQGTVPFVRQLDAAERGALTDALIDALLGMGPIEGMLADSSITEVMVNGTHSIYFERDGVLVRSGKVMGSDEEVRALIDRIIGPLGRRIDESSPMVDARLPEGHRVHAIIPPLALDGPILTIRKFTARVITLDEMVQLGSMDASMAQLLRWAIAARVSIAVSGGTGTGKTTLLNALSCEIPTAERILTIEDSAELRFLEHPHVVRMEARPPNAEGSGAVTIRELVVNALRMRPDRIVVGECRGPEALDMLQAMNTGHDGSLTTLHANSPADAVSRLTVMVRYAADLPTDVIEHQVASAIDLVLQLQRGPTGQRFLSEAVAFSYDAERRAVRTEELFERSYFSDRGRWAAPPDWLTRLVRKGLATEGEVEEWMRSVGLPVSPS